MSADNYSWTAFLPAFLRERLHGRLQLQKILSNIVWLSLDKVLRLGLGAIVGIWMARYLGPDQYGVLNFAAAFVVLFSPLATLGLDSLVVRDLLREPSPLQQISLGTAFGLRSAGSILAAVLSIVLVSWVRPGDSLTLALVAVTSLGLVFQSFDVIDFWFQSIVKSKFVVYARNGAFLALTVVRVIMLLMHAPVLLFGVAATAELALSALGLVLMYSRNGGAVLQWRAAKRRALQYLRDAWPLAFSSVAVIVYMRIGQVMVGSYLDNRSVGTYSVAVKLAEIWYFIPIAIASSVFPSVLTARTVSDTLYRKRLQHFYNVMSIISLSVACVTTAFSQTIINLLYGKEFAEAGPVLTVYIWASVPVFLGIASSQYLIAENLTRISMYRTVAGSAVNVIMNMLLIPAWGTIGAALSTLLAYFVATFFIVVFPSLREQVKLMIQSLNPYSLVRFVATSIRG